jgi:integrase
MSYPDSSVVRAGLFLGEHASPFAGADVCTEAGLRIRPGARTVMFTDEVWHFAGVEGLPVQMRDNVTRFVFTSIKDPRWRLVAKEYLFARLAPRNEQVAVLPHAYRTPLTLWTCSQRLDETTRWLNWLTTQHVGSLAEVTQEHCERYLAQRQLRRDKAGAVIGTLQESVTRLAAAVIIELALYGELFTADRYHERFIPWGGRSSSQVAGMRPSAQNKTPILEQRILQPMLAAALYLTETLGSHVVELRRQVRDRHEKPRPAEIGIGYQDLARVLHHHTDTGLPLEAARDGDIAGRLAQGWNPTDPLLQISTGALAREAGTGRLRPDLLAAIRPLLEQTLSQVGTQKPWGRNAVPVSRANDADTVPWTLMLDERDVRDLVGYTQTACLIIAATVTGLRASELMELRVGCRRSTTHGEGMLRHRLISKITKGQPMGGTEDEWVVVEQVDQAVALAEQLVSDETGDALVFGPFAFPIRYWKFRDWVNGLAGQRLGLAPIPEGVVSMRMLRRTLAHELAYRPGGLLATKIALKHVTVATTEGYAARPGGAQAKLLAEIGEYETERNLQLVLAEFRNYQDGVMPAGPGARELIEFFGTVDGDLAEHAAIAPNVVPGDQHVLNLLSKRAQVLHLAAANYCWFSDPSRALCLKLAGTPGADKPLAGMCDSARCPQATHHPCHRPVWADTVGNTTVFLGALGRTRKTERTRLQAELDRAQRILSAIDAATSTDNKDD